MMYKIFARKDNKAFCYAVDNVEETTNGYYFRDIKNNAFYGCSKDQIVEILLLQVESFTDTKK